ncbi:LysE family translocator [Paenibacillus agri]|uniref:LysE family translocator n=1 Tax=Paenibacillus agri TaxID=2744309 RepID=A0A850EML3_9BACL|nr:LysE family translocator [Paenibacillus agri]NUU62255.1 LysE family translocator [Paenibacillus agri]
MTWEWLAKGILLGVSIAAPVGPISILCIKETLTSGFKNGLSCGLGAATADAIYGCIAGLGLSTLTTFLVDYKTLLQALGGLFICYLGMKSLLSTPRMRSSTESYSPKNLLNTYIVTLLLTLSNPMTIVFFLGVFSASGVQLSHNNSDMPFLIGGVFLGSVIWWICLVGSTTLFRSKMTAGGSKQTLFNKLSGLVMLSFGILALIQSLGL